MDLKSNTTNSTAPKLAVSPGEPSNDQLREGIDRARNTSAPRIRPVVSSVDELDESFDGDEAVLQDNSGSSMLKFMDGQWKQFHGSLSGLKVQIGNDGVPALRMTIGGRRFKVALVEDTDTVSQSRQLPQGDADWGQLGQLGHQPSNP